MSSGQVLEHVLEQQEVVGAPRVHGPLHLQVGIGSRMSDTAEGRARIAAALERYIKHCEMTETPWIKCHGGTAELEVRDGHI